MTEALLTCEICRKANKNFKVPYDKVGITFMVEHLRNDHGVTKQINILGL